MKILALDLATHTGWACGDADGEPRFGVKVIGKPGEEIGKFASLFDEWFFHFVAEEEPRMIVFESPILAAKTTPATARKLMGLAFLTELVAYRWGIECREVHLQQVKKFMTGNGRADKAAMIAAARGHGWLVNDDNAADALGVWALAVHTLQPGCAGRFALGSLGERTCT